MSVRLVDDDDDDINDKREIHFCITEAIKFVMKFKFAMAILSIKDYGYHISTVFASNYRSTQSVVVSFLFNNFIPHKNEAIHLDSSARSI